MRHNTFTLDSETAAKAKAIRDTLEQANGDGIGVRISVMARDPKPGVNPISERVGPIVGWAGVQGMSNETVLLDTDKGVRSFNVWLIRSAEIVGL